MSGILRLESLTKGNTLKQGDKTPLKYRLFDADGEKLNIAGKSAQVRLVYPDFLTIGYEKDGLTVAQDDTVTFTIDSVIPSRIYHVEIIVDGQFIFPSRSDESKFTVDKSSLGTEANIIEIVGKDVLINAVKSQVDAELQPLVTSLQAAEQAEAQRVTVEASRVSAEAQRKTDHANRSAELAGKADKVVLENVIKNGDFSDGLTGWVNFNDRLNVEFIEDFVRLEGITEGGRLQHSVEVNPDDKVYYSVSTRSVNVIDPSMGVGSSLLIHRGFTNSEDWVNESGIYNITSGNLSIIVRAVGNVLDVRHVIAINLTQTFGAGNEPTKEEMDELLEATGYIEGEYALNNKEMLGHLMKSIREKADIVTVKNSLVNLHPNNPKTLHALSTHTTTTDMYLMEYVVDLDGLGLVNGQPINTSFMYYTEDDTLTDLTIDVYLLNVDTPNTYAGGLTFANNPPSSLSLGEIAVYSGDFGTYSSAYRYAHVYIRAFITDKNIYHDFSLAEFTLKIGDITVPDSRVLSVNPHRVSEDSTLLPQWPLHALNAVGYSDLSKGLSELDKKIENSVNLSSSRFNGGKWNFLGDSITDPNHGGASVKYWVHLKEMFGLAEARPYGLSSSTISNAPNAQAYRPMSVRYTEMDDDADVVTVFAGTNDYGYSNATWGAFYNEDGTINKDDTTFYGACHVLFEGLLKKYASRGTTIFITTPIPRQSITAPNPTTGKLLKDYAQVIKEVAEFYSLPVLDLFTMSGLQANVPEVKTAYVPDGVHPNNKGHVVLANKFAGMLRTL